MGESVCVYVDANGDLSRALVTSKPRMRPTFVDYGKGAENTKLVRDALQAGVAAGAS